MMRYTFFISLLLLFSGCGDDATVIQSEKNLAPLQCLRLVVFPPDKQISQTLSKLYKFQQNCPYELQVSRKGGIVCNSNQNADKKALSNFPTGYIRMDLYKKRKSIYSYYKDLHAPLSQKDIQNAFARLKSDLLEK